MMEQLLEMAKKVSDQAEIYSLSERIDGVSFENAKLKEIQSKIQSGISLRILGDGKQGFAYTKNLLNRQDLIQNALNSLRGEVEASFDLPLTKEVPSLGSYSSSVETLSNSKIVEECTRVCERLTSKTTGQINLSGHRALSRIRLINSRGTDLSSASSAYSFGTEILYPGSYSSIQRQLFQKAFETASEAYLNFILDLYNRSQTEVAGRSGRMKVLFLPETMYVLLWRLQSATSGKTVYQKVSPVMGKMGEKILDEKLTIYDDPLNDALPDPRGFDDEGTPCHSLSIIEKGTLRNFYSDLFYAEKLKAPPTGHGYKSSMWGGETVSLKPSPSLQHLSIKAGGKTLSELIGSMDKGVIVAGAIGAHSGNILNGDFSIGLSPGLVVEQGEIIGHIKDAMVSGNIYDTMKQIVEMEDALHPAYTGQFPAVLFEDVAVATKA